VSDTDEECAHVTLMRNVPTNSPLIECLNLHQCYTVDPQFGIHQGKGLVERVLVMFFFSYTSFFGIQFGGWLSEYS
jgi:hypothetical protein